MMLLIRFLMRLLACFSLSACLMLAACAPFQSAVDTRIADTHAALNEQKTPTIAKNDARAHFFSMAGRFSVRYAINGNNTNVYGNFNWNQQGDVIQIELSTPTGQTLATLQVDANGARLQAQGRSVQARTPEALTQEQFGWSLPVTGLRYWLEGKLAPAPEGLVDESSRLSSDGNTLQQDGWVINITRRYNEGAHKPRLLELQRSMPLELGIKLVIDERSDYAD